MIRQEPISCIAVTDPTTGVTDAQPGWYTATVVTGSAPGANAVVATTWTAANLSLPNLTGVTLTNGMEVICAGVGDGSVDAIIGASGTFGVVVSPETSRITTSASEVAANGTATATITVTVLASNGTALANKTVTLTASGGSSTISPASVTTNGAGAAAFTVSDTVEETVTYSATDTTDGVALAGSVTVTFVGAPTAPGTPDGSAQSAAVALNWSAPASDGGTAITSYDIEYSSNGGSTWSAPISTGSSSTAYTVSGLTNGTSYVFRVAATGAGGTGPYSAQSAAVTPVATAGGTKSQYVYTVPVTGTPGVLVGDPSGDYIYGAATNTGNGNAITLYKISTTTGAVVASLAIGTGWVRAICISSDGLYVYVSYCITPQGEWSGSGTLNPSTIVEVNTSNLTVNSSLGPPGSGDVSGIALTSNNMTMYASAWSPGTYLTLTTRPLTYVTYTTMGFAWGMTVNPTNGGEWWGDGRSLPKYVFSHSGTFAVGIVANGVVISPPTWMSEPAGAGSINVYTAISSTSPPGNAGYAHQWPTYTAENPLDVCIDPTDTYAYVTAYNGGAVAKITIANGMWEYIGGVTAPWGICYTNNLVWVADTHNSQIVALNP